MQNRRAEIFHTIIKGLWEYKLYLLLFALILCFIYFTGFNGLYGQDSYEYLRFTNALIAAVKNGINPGKDYWPILYPVCGAIISILFKPLLSLQLVSIISLVVSGIYLEKILTVLYALETRLIRFFAFSFFLLSPYPLRASLTVMSDSLCMFFVTAAVYYLLKFKEEKSNNFFVCFTGFATAAISTRYAAFVVIVIPAICAGYYFFKKFRLKPFLQAGIVAMLILLPYVLTHKNSPADFFQHEWLQNWSFTNFFRSGFTTADGIAVYSFQNIIYCFSSLIHPAYCFAGILFIVFSFKSLIKNGVSNVRWIFIASLSLYAFFLAGIPFQNLRFLMLSFPLVLIILFPGFAALSGYMDTYNRRIKGVVFTVCIVIQMTLFVRVFIPFYNDNKLEKQVAGEVIKCNPGNIFTFSIDGDLRCYGYKGNIINLWSVKVDTLKPLNGTEMILFNEKQFNQEWKNKNPMINWEYLKTKYQLVKAEDLPDNWELYYITGSGGGTAKMPVVNLF